MGDLGQNFQQPGISYRNPNDPNDPNAPADGSGMVWDPTGGPNGQGAYVPHQRSAAPSGPAHTFDAGAWGGKGMDVDYQGRPIEGSSGAQLDAFRYQQMGQKPLFGNGPQIDQTQANEARDVGVGALGMLKMRADGSQETPAQALARQQTAGAVAGIQSGAATIKGGAMARAAAARGAQAQGARVAAMGQQDLSALRAREMADASGQYFGASTAQRTADLGVATQQAQLEASQRAQNDQREAFYENKAQDTKAAELSHQLGRTGAENAAANAAQATANQAQAASDARIDRNLSTGTGAVMGGIQAYGKATSDPYDPNKTGSDERMKTGVRPVSDKEAARLKKQGASMLDGIDAQRRAAGLSTVDTDANKDATKGYRPPGISDKMDPTNPYGEGPRDRVRARAAEYDRSMFAKHDDGTVPNTEALHAGIEKQIADDAPAGNIIRKDPYAPQSMFGGRMGETADLGYARSRKGHAGYMFGGAPEASYGNLRYDGDAGFAEAPGSTDARFGAGPLRDKFSRDVAMSDAHAKRAAFLDGVNHTQALQDTGEIKPPPDYMQDAPKARAGQPSTLKRTAAKLENLLVDDKGIVAMPTSGGLGDPTILPKAFYGATEAAKSLRMAPDNAKVEYARARKAYERFGSPTAVAAIPPTTRQPVSFTREETTSDERAKTAPHDSPMADANRSMAPSTYEYKPEFAGGEGQAPGEKNVGPMAQTMAADPIAKTAIVKDPESGLLGIDKSKGLKLVMGGLSDVQRQIDDLKRRKA